MAAVAALAGTAAYLDSIEIDDGLEALVFLPILVVVGLAAGAFGAWCSSRIAWPLICAAAAALVIALVFLTLFATRRPGSSALPFVVMSVVLFFPLLSVGTLSGWALGRSHLRRRRAA